MAMDQFLAEYFGNNVNTSSPDETEAEKTAQMKLFCKLAADNGIDLDKLSDAQIAYLWNETFKYASDSEKGDDDDDESKKQKESEGDDLEEKKEEAKKELEEKKEAMAKMAEATFLGKVMAHSLVSELRKIGAAYQDVDPGELFEEKEAGAKDALKSTANKAVELIKRPASAAVGDVKQVLRSQKQLKSLRNLAKDHGVLMDPSVETNIKNLRNKALKRTAARLGIAAGAAGAAGGAGLAAHQLMKKKESSAIDELALVEAVKLAEASGFDRQEAADRVLGVFHLDLLGDSEKVASAVDADDAVHIRALEFLEAAGYPVVWSS